MNNQELAELLLNSLERAITRSTEIIHRDYQSMENLSKYGYESFGYHKGRIAGLEHAQNLINIFMKNGTI